MEWIPFCFASGSVFKVEQRKTLSIEPRAAKQMACTQKYQKSRATDFIRFPCSFFLKVDKVIHCISHFLPSFFVQPSATQWFWITYPVWHGDKLLQLWTLCTQHVLSSHVLRESVTWPVFNSTQGKQSRAEPPPPGLPFSSSLQIWELEGHGQIREPKGSHT